MANLGSVGEASVELRARQNKFKGDLKKAESDSRSAGRQAGKAFASGFNARAAALKGAIAGLFSAAAFKSFLAGAEKAIDKLDEIAKTADSIGVTTDALQELRVAADLSGVSAEALNTGLRRFSRGIAEAADGTQQYVDTFNGLGVSVKNTDGTLRNVDEVLNDVADRFAQMDDATRKASLAQDLFGRAGVGMVNLLNEGSDGIERMRKEARALGIVIDESLIRQSVIAKDQLTLLKKVIDAEMTTALANAAPLLVDFVRLIAAITNAAADAYQGLRLLFDLPVNDANIRKFQITEQMAELDAQIADTTEGLKNFIETGSRTGSIIPGLPGLTKTPSDEDINRELEATSDKVAELEAEKLKLAQELADISGTPVVPGKTEEVQLPGFEFTPTEAKSSGTSEIDKKKEAFAALTEEIQKNIQAEVEEQAVIDAKTQTLGEEAVVRDLLIEKLRQSGLEADVYKAAQEAGLDTTDAEVQKTLELAAALGKVTEERIKQGDAFEKTQEQIKEAESANRELATSLEGLGQGFLQTAIQGGDLKQAVADLIPQLVELALRMAIFGSISGGAGDSLSGPLGSALSGLFSGISFFADGGAASKGQLAVVGEEGPELGVFGSNAKVFSNDDLKQILTAPTNQQTTQTTSKNISVNFNVSTPDVGGFRRSQPQMSAELRQLLDAANRQI